MGVSARGGIGKGDSKRISLPIENAETSGSAPEGAAARLMLPCACRWLPFLHGRVAANWVQMGVFMGCRSRISCSRPVTTPRFKPSRARSSTASNTPGISGNAAWARKSKVAKFLAWARASPPTGRPKRRTRFGVVPGGDAGLLAPIAFLGDDHPAGRQDLVQIRWWTGSESTSVPSWSNSMARKVMG